MAAKRKCKHCGFFAYDMIKIQAGSFCNLSHAAKWGVKKAAKDRERKAKKLIKADNKKHAERKRTYYDNDVKTRKKAVKLACHAYIRLRDKDRLCICCDKSLGDDYHAGHFLESGNNPLTRYDENNIHAQRLDCNYFKGGDSGKYKENLIKKIGVFEYWCLMMRKGGTDTRTAQDYKEIELYYKAKLIKLSHSME